jgi:hypothetical protein
MKHKKKTLRLLAQHFVVQHLYDMNAFNVEPVAHNNLLVSWGPEAPVP